MSVEDIRHALYVVLSDSDISDKILTHYYSNHNHPEGQESLIEMTFVINKREFHRHVLTLIWVSLPSQLSAGAFLSISVISRLQQPGGGQRAGQPSSVW